MLYIRYSPEIYLTRLTSIENKTTTTAFITGSAGFIGFHMSNKLLSQGWRVVGFDCLSDYYDVVKRK